MLRALRWLLAGTAIVLLLAGAAIAGVLWWSLPGPAMDAGVPGLSATARIGFDADGIPRIDAATPQDAATALGFVHARDRMMQMDLMRRAASGRLSELVGPATLRLDRTMRTLGLRRRAEADLVTLAPETRAMLDAYARGVNAWIAARGRFAAPEFIPLGAPEPWTPVDSLLWGKTMALYLSGNWRQEIARAALRNTLAPERLRALWPSQDGTPAPDARVLGTMTRLAALVPAFPEPFTLPATASNEWAVDGAHSQTGAPLLAGDPHLAYGMPGIWYLARITTPSAVLTGATAPGIPFLVMGHNGRIAWTFTTTGADTQDVFVETPTPGGTYATPDGPRPFDRREERIRVRGAPDDVLTVRETRHGPVLSDLDDPAGPILAVAMANLAPGDSAATGLLALNRATSIAEAGTAAALIAAPVQNLLVADPGAIGQFTTGRIPIRRSGDGTLPVPGADGAADWTGFASGDALPHQLAPASGRIVNANERVAPPSFPVFMGQDWFGDWRARRIRALLDERTTHSVQSFAAMQVDVTSAFAQAILPRLLRTPPADPASRAALAALQRWDGAMRTDKSQPLLFNDWMRRFEAALRARDSLPPGLSGTVSDAIARALGPDAATWCGDACDALLTTTLAAAARDFDLDTSWGSLHRAEFQHPILGRLPLIGRLFTWSIEQPGDETTIFRGGIRSPDWTSVHGPSYRGVYDLANLDRSLFAVTPGQSGHPLRALAGNLMQRWRDGTSIRLAPITRPVETVTLHPGQPS